MSAKSDLRRRERDALRQLKTRPRELTSTEVSDSYGFGELICNAYRCRACHEIVIVQKQMGMIQNERDARLQTCSTCSMSAALAS